MDDEPPIRLVPLEDEHVLLFLPLSHDPVLVETMGWRPFDLDESERFRRYVENITVPNLIGGYSLTFSIISTKDDMPIGYISLNGIRDGGTGAEISLAIMDKRYRGRGLGLEALRQAVAYAFDDLELSMLALTVFPSNTPAIRSYESIGFVKTEVLKEVWELPDGTYADMQVMELWKPEPGDPPAVS